jgi:glucose-1-phosphate adenylyltransferase
VIDKACVIEDGTVIGKNLEEDRKRFHVTDEGIVLVTPAMLGQALHVVKQDSQDPDGEDTELTAA